MSWHVRPSTLADYLSGAVGDVDAWSVEAHLADCAVCRDRMASLTRSGAAPEVAATVHQVRAALMGELPRQGELRPGTWPRRCAVLTRSVSLPGSAWLASALLVFAAAVLVEALGIDVRAGAPWPWLAIVGPVVPVAGVAVGYAAPLDDAAEAVAATPMSGLRLLLWRTLVVLAGVVPVAVAASLFTPYTTSAAWLMPALALTAVTVALMSAVEPLVAATAVGVGWLAVVGVAGLGERGPQAIQDLVLSGSATLPWLACGAFAAAVIYLRRAAYGAPSAVAAATSEEPW